MRRMTNPIRVALVDPPRQLRHTGVVKFRPEGTVVPTEKAAALPSSSVADGDTRTAIVRLLLESGTTTASSIGERLGLSAAGVRRHLDALIEAGDAQAKSAAAWQQEGRGRPAKRYQLTAAGRAKLEHTYDDLASAAMRALREIGGDDAVHTFARRRIDTILAGVAPATTDDADDVEAAAERVADALSRAGYATTTTQVRGPLGGVQICQHHCPVYHVAEEFPELCEAEQEAMAEVLGTHVQRLATIVNGDCACTTHVPAHSPRRDPSASKRSVSQ
ncbi:helix-turn-helix transcriptional regulator [Mycolicibacterium obuense]|nr:metalloregulator ArsR/SmtB family transcription factor [Mycolicibacterium obuense]